MKPLWEEGVEVMDDYEMTLEDFEDEPEETECAICKKRHEKCRC